LRSAHSCNHLLPSLHGSDAIHLLCGVPIHIPNPTSKERAQHTSQLLNNSLSNRLLSPRHNTHEAILHSSAPLILLPTPPRTHQLSIRTIRTEMLCLHLGIRHCSLFALLSNNKPAARSIDFKKLKQKSYNREPRKERRRRSMRDILP
jgi:hypothetical protein